jgi:hypothetical protein
MRWRHARMSAFENIQVPLLYRLDMTLWCGAKDVRVPVRARQSASFECRVMSLLIPKSPIDRAAFGPPTGCSFQECTVSRIVNFGPRSSRNGRGTAKYVSLRFLSLTQRLALLRRHKVRAVRPPTRQRYLVQAEEYRFQAETISRSGDASTNASIGRDLRAQGDAG